MAITHGDVCIQCYGKEARHDSHFCSPACREAYAASVDGPVACDGAHSVGCFAEADTIAEAEAAGWTLIEADPEGVSWNHLGRCPDCSKLEATP